MKVLTALGLFFSTLIVISGCQRDNAASLDSYSPPPQEAEADPGFQVVEGLSCTSTDANQNDLSISIKKHDDYLQSSKVKISLTAKTATGVEFKREMEAVASELSLSGFLIKDEKGNILASNESTAYAPVPEAEADEGESFDMQASVFLKSDDLKIAAGASQRQVGCNLDKTAFGDVSMSARMALMSAVFQDNHLFSNSLQTAEQEMAARGFARATDKIAVENSHDGRPTGMTELTIPYVYKGGTLNHGYTATVSVETRFVDGKFTVLDLKGIAVKKTGQ